jgi:hypothetical protein
MTGTALDLTPFGSVLTALGWLYWLLAAGALWWALRGARPVKQKALRVLAVLGVFSLLPGYAAWNGYVVEAKLKKAEAHFEMRCKTAGERIVRTVDNVEGVVWMKWRDKPDVNDDYDQYKLSDPYGRDCTAESCIEQLLSLDSTQGRFAQEVERRRGRYRFVDSINPADGKKYHYVGAMVPRWSDESVAKYRAEKGKDVDDDVYWFKHTKTEITGFSARYGITWDDISTRDDRDHWIAGGSLKLIDMKTNEVIAERVGYMIDRGLGSKTGFRSPWTMARRSACPPFPGGMHRYPATDNVLFVLKVLRPTKGS